jgi:hypothetical protein
MNHIGQNTNNQMGLRKFANISNFTMVINCYKQYCLCQLAVLKKANKYGKRFYRRTVEETKIQL